MEGIVHAYCLFAHSTRCTVSPRVHGASLDAMALVEYTHFSGIPESGETVRNHRYGLKWQKLLSTRNGLLTLEHGVGDGYCS